MRPLVGFLGFNGLALLLGLAVLYATGLVQLRLRSLAEAAGAALLTGLAGLGLGALVAVIAGIGIDLLVVVAIALFATAALALVGRLRGSRAAEPAAAPDAGGPSRLSLALCGLVAVFVAIQVLSSRHVPVAWDAAHIWSLKAMALSDWGELQGRLFTDAGVFSIAHLDYPLGWPVLGSLELRATGNAEQGALVGQLWVILGATVLTVPWLVRGRRWAALAFVPMLLAMISAPSAGLLRGDADVPMACFVAAGVAGLARALESRRPGYAVLAAIWLGMAANTKNEGLAFSAGVLVATFAVAMASRRRGSVLMVAAAGAAVVVLAAPWKLWTSAHGPFVSDVAPLSDALDLGYLADKLPQLDLGAQRLLGRLADPGSVSLVPALIALAGAAIVSRRSASTAALYLGSLVLSVLAVLWVYWTSQLVDIVGHIERTTIRTITGPVFIAAAGLAHLLPRLLGEIRLDEVVAPRDEVEPAAREPALSP